MKRAVMIMAMAVLVPVFACVFPAGAQDSVNERLLHQQRRIEHGVDDRFLTPRENRMLQKEQREIERERRKALRDGHLSPEERRRLHRMQDKADRDRFMLEHNQTPPLP